MLWSGRSTMSHDAFRWQLLLVLLGAACACCAQTRPLTVAEAKLLLTSTPDYVLAKKKRGCPEIELGWQEATEAVFQLRNTCPKSGSGLLGNYTVDLRSGQVWIGVDRDQLVQSPLLRQALSKIHGKKRAAVLAR